MSDKKKQFFFPSSRSVNTTIWMHQVDADLEYEEKAWQQLHNATSCTEVLEATPHKTVAVRPPITHHENYLS